uniref:Uncharacterized protein n=1 Tax=Setaria digitata TaxID=48799 RepID=A0A915Q6J5_9BILA
MDSSSTYTDGNSSSVTVHKRLKLNKMTVRNSIWILKIPSEIETVHKADKNPLELNESLIQTKTALIKRHISVKTQPQSGTRTTETGSTVENENETKAEASWLEKARQVAQQSVR